MIEKTDVLKMARHVFRHSQGYKDQKLMHPRRDWVLLMLLTVVIFFGGTAFAVSTYLRFEEVIESPTPAFISTVNYDKDQTEQALDIFAQREAEFTRIRELNAQLPNSSTENATSTATTTTVIDTAIATSSASSAENATSSEDSITVE